MQKLVGFISAFICAIWLTSAFAAPVNWSTGVLIKKPSGTTPGFIPSDLGTKVPFWFGAQYSATVHTTGTGTIHVTQWDNKGSDGGSITVPAGSTQPVFLPAALNSNPAISGDGVQMALHGTGFTTPVATDLTIFMIVRHNQLATTTNQVIWNAGGTGGPGMGSFFTGTPSSWRTGPNDLATFGNGANAGTSRVGVTAANWGSDVTDFFRIVSTVGSVAGTVSKNGTPQTVYGATTGGTIPAITTLSFDIFRDGFSQWGAADIGEIVVCFDCTSTDKANINAYLTVQWGLWFFPGFFYRRRRAANDNEPLQALQRRVAL